MFTSAVTLPVGRRHNKSIVAGTPLEQFVSLRRKPACDLTEAQVALIGRESDDLDREVRLIEQWTISSWLWRLCTLHDWSGMRASYDI